MGTQYIDPMTLCHVCHAWQAHVVCEDCIHVFAQPTVRCLRCALAHGSAPLHACDIPSPAWDQCIAAVDYAYPWSHCITQLKFGEHVGLAATLARLMRHTPWAEPALEQADRLIPMPLSAQRLAARGFNQALELTRHLMDNAHGVSSRISQDSPLKRPDIDTTSLVRLETDAHQVGASRAQRWAQTEASFYIAPESIRSLQGQRIVLIDDVMTTGATLHAAARCLRRAGVASITALVFARTLPPSAHGSVAESRIADNAGHVQYRAGSP